MRAWVNSLPQMAQWIAPYSRGGVRKLAAADGQNLSGSGLGRRVRNGPGLRERERAESIGRDRKRDGLSGRHADARIGDNSLHGELRIFLADLAAGKAAGVTAFIGQPDLHAALAGLFDGELSKYEMFRR